MFDIIFYRNRQGHQPVKEYLRKLASQSDKDSRIKLGKIDYCLQALRAYGTATGQPIVKHISDDIWELRPLSDRMASLSLCR